MLFFLLIFSLLSPLINGMDQNDYWVCCNSCWNDLENLCPQHCWNLHLGECINVCWNSFCDYCNSFFGNQNANQSDDHYEEEECEADHDGDRSEWKVQEDNRDIEGQWEDYTRGEWEEMPSTSQGQTGHYQYEEEECEAEYEDDESEGKFREYDTTEGGWQEMPSTSQGQTGHHYDNWDEDVPQYNPDIHIQFGGMNIGDQSSQKTYESLSDLITAQINSASLSDGFLADIIENLNSEGRTHRNDFDLLDMFDVRILQNIRQICEKLGSRIYEDSPWTSHLCNIADNIDYMLSNIRNQKDNGNHAYYSLFTRISKHMMALYEKNHEICYYVDEADVEHDVQEIIYPIYFQKNIKNWREKTLQKLTAKTNELINEGIQLKYEYKTTSDNIKLLPGIEFIRNNVDDVKERAKYLTNDLLKKLARKACKVTKIISQLCFGEPYLNCLLLGPALTIFSVELFITTIFADGFDHLVGKWPFSMYKNFEEGESSRRGGNGSD